MLLVHSAIVGIVALFAGVIIFGNQQVFKPRKTLQTPKDLSSKHGGAYHQVDENNRLEYFNLFTQQKNANRPKTAIVVFNGRGTGLGVCRREMESIQSVFMGHPIEDVQLVCVSLPGTGGSDPLGAGEIPTERLIGRMTVEVSKLIQEKGILRVYALGIGYGAEFAANFAQRVLKAETDLGGTIKMKGMVLTSPQPFPSESYDIFGNGHNQNGLMKIMVKVFNTLNKSVIYYRGHYMGEGTNEDLDFFENNQLKYVKKTVEEKDIEIVREDLTRINEFYHHSAVVYSPKVKGFHTFEEKVEDFTEYAYFNRRKDVPVHVYVGKFDERTGRRGIAFLMNTIKHAKLYEFKGGYFEQPLAESIQSILADVFKLDNEDFNTRYVEEHAAR